MVDIYAVSNSGLRRSGYGSDTLMEESAEMRVLTKKGRAFFFPAFRASLSVGEPTFTLVRRGCLQCTRCSQWASVAS